VTLVQSTGFPQQMQLTGLAASHAAERSSRNLPCRHSFVNETAVAALKTDLDQTFLMLRHASVDPDLQNLAREIQVALRNPGSSLSEAQG